MDAAVAEPPVEEVAEEVVESPPPVLTGLTMGAVRKSIDNLTAENFETTLNELEPFFLNEAGASIYAKSMRRIARNAKALGVTMPDKYAFEAKCTAKKRSKQDAFIQVKEEERLEAEAATGEAEAPVEEPELVAA